MDIDFIEQFYYGNITPGDCSIKRGSTLAKACKAFADVEEVLSTSLTGENEQTLLAMSNAHLEIVGLTDQDAFCAGFRLGVPMILDVMAGTGELYGRE